jgi:hypothetical protein
VTEQIFQKHEKEMANNTPTVLWAQREKRLMITIDLPEVKDPKIDITDSKLTFSGSSNGKQ